MSAGIDQIRPGDRIVWGQGTGEPTTLIEALLARRAELGGVSAFVGSSFSDLLQPEHADHIAFSSMGALGGLARLAKGCAGSPGLALTRTRCVSPCRPPAPRRG